MSNDTVEGHRKYILDKEKNSLSEYEDIMKGTGMFKDIRGIEKKKLPKEDKKCRSVTNVKTGTT